MINGLVRKNIFINLFQFLLIFFFILYLNVMIEND